MDKKQKTKDEGKKAYMKSEIAKNALFPHFSLFFMYSVKLISYYKNTILSGVKSMNAKLKLYVLKSEKELGKPNIIVPHLKSTTTTQH